MASAFNEVTIQGVSGPVVIGTAISTTLLGLTIDQTFTYFANSSHDRTNCHILVIVLLLIDITHTVFCQMTIWQWFVRHSGLARLITNGKTWTMALTPVACATSTLLVQLFYAHRIYVISRRRWYIPVIIFFGSIYQLAWAIFACTQLMVLEDYMKRHVRFGYMISISWTGTAAFTDCIITGSLVYYLSRSKTMFCETNHVLNRLIRLAIETNGITCAVAALDVILFACREDFMHIVPNLSLEKLYVLSLLVSLNSRNSMVKSLAGPRSLPIGNTYSNPTSILPKEIPKCRFGRSRGVANSKIQLQCPSSEPQANIASSPPLYREDDKADGFHSMPTYPKIPISIELLANDCGLNRHEAHPV